MSKKNIVSSFGGYGSSIGVIKFSYKVKGFPEIKKLAEEWAKNPNFKEVIIRKVSKDDFGIQFIYYKENVNESSYSEEFMDEFINPIRSEIYAYDINHSSGDTKDSVLDGIVKQEIV